MWIVRDVELWGKHRYSVGGKAIEMVGINLVVGGMWIVRDVEQSVGKAYTT